MASVSVTTTFSANTTAKSSEVNQNFTDLVNYINNRNDGTSTWDALRVTTSSAVVAILNNSTGTSNILNCQDNGTNVFSIADGGASTITATAGGSSVALTINNSTSTGNILTLQDNGTEILSVADGGTIVFNETGLAAADFRMEGDTNANMFFLDASADAIGIGHAAPTAALHIIGLAGSTQQAFIVNNNTSTGNVLTLQDGGTEMLALADGGTMVFNETGLSGDVWRMEGDTDANLFYLKASGDGIGIGTASPHASSILNLASTTKGFIPPRMTTAQRDAIGTPSSGLIIYNDSTNKINVYTGSAWEAVTSS